MRPGRIMIVTMSTLQGLYYFLAGRVSSPHPDSHWHDVGETLGLLEMSRSRYAYQLTPRGDVFMQIMKQHISVQQRQSRLILLALPLLVVPPPPRYSHKIPPPKENNG